MSLAIFEIESWLVEWLLYTLLPSRFWHKQMKKQKNPKLKTAYQKAYGQALSSYYANVLN
ncbi:MAG: hypothetical protein HQL94_04580 [Magnetococcales bacterium]|nr:hypothetical protein [Magnetococcales bacterium]MBF0439062.1 hypothetical protein [Magnetococcales bacterium]